MKCIYHKEKDQSRAIIITTTTHFLARNLLEQQLQTVCASKILSTHPLKEPNSPWISLSFSCKLCRGCFIHTEKSNVHCRAWTSWESCPLFCCKAKESANNPCWVLLDCFFFLNFFRRLWTFFSYDSSWAFWLWSSCFPVLGSIPSSFPLGKKPLAVSQDSQSSIAWHSYHIHSEEYSIFLGLQIFFFCVWWRFVPSLSLLLLSCIVFFFNHNNSHGFVQATAQSNNPLLWFPSLSRREADGVEAQEAAPWKLKGAATAREALLMV